MEPARLGFFFGAPAAGYLIGNFLSGRYSVRVGMNNMVLFGAMTTASGMLMSMFFFSLGYSSEYVFFGFMILVGVGNGLTLPNANAGLMGVRPDLAGSAAGLGGALMIGGGAALSALSGILLGDGNSAMPLLWVMLISALLSLVSILYVIHRARKLGL